MTFPPDFPLRPPKMKFLTEMWHPNGTSGPHALALSGSSQGQGKGTDRIRVVTPAPRAQCTRTENCASRSCTNRARTSTGTRTPERGGCPSTRSSRSCAFLSLFFFSLLQKDDWFLAESARTECLPRRLVLTRQLISVISLLSQDTPDINSPANVDAAVRSSSLSLYCQARDRALAATGHACRHLK